MEYLILGLALAPLWLPPSLIAGLSLLVQAKERRDDKAASQASLVPEDAERGQQAEATPLHMFALPYQA